MEENYQKINENNSSNNENSESKKIRILLIHNFYRKFGGEDSVFLEEREAIEKYGKDNIEVYQYTVDNKNIKNNIFSKINTFFKSFHNGKVYKDIVKLINNKKIDIVHIHNFMPLITPKIYRIIKQKTKAKIVQTIHNFRFICPNGLLYCNNTLCDGFKSIFICTKNRCYRNSYIETFLYGYLIKKYQIDFKEKIDKYIVLNNFHRKKLIEYGFDEKKMVLKPNSLPFFNNEELSKLEENKEEYEKINDKQKKYFLYLGRLSYEKGIDFLLDTFSKTDKNIKIAGSGEKLDFYKEKYKNNKNIEFLGFLTGFEKIKYIYNSQAIIIPSICYENLPVTMIEAFRCGVPVIVPDNESFKYLVENEVNGIFYQQKNSESLLKIIDYYLENDIKNKLVKNCLKIFSELYEKEKVIKKLIDVYKNLLIYEE